MITSVHEVRGDNINWGALGKRFRKFREARHMSQLEAATEIDLSESQIASFEEGFYSDRKSTNIIWNISLKWNLSINWLLNGLGKPHDPDPLGLMPETLHVQKGAGIRRNYSRLEAEEGRFTDHVLEFVMAVDKFKSKHQVSFPTLTQVYEIITALGYRKSVPPRIAPLGYIIEHQQWAEKLKQVNEKIETSLDLSDEEFRAERSERTKPLSVKSGFQSLSKSKPKPAAISDAEKQRRLKIGQSTRVRGKKFILIDSEGRQYIVNNLTEFCRANKLMPSHMYSVANGDRKQHKGWRAARGEQMINAAQVLESLNKIQQPKATDHSVLERIKSGLS